MTTVKEEKKESKEEKKIKELEESLQWMEKKLLQIIITGIWMFTGGILFIVFMNFESPKSFTQVLLAAVWSGVLAYIFSYCITSDVLGQEKMAKIWPYCPPTNEKSSFDFQKKLAQYRRLYKPLHKDAIIEQAKSQPFRNNGSEMLLWLCEYQLSDQNIDLIKETLTEIGCPVGEVTMTPAGTYVVRFNI